MCVFIFFKTLYPLLGSLILEVQQVSGVVVLPLTGCPLSEGPTVAYLIFLMIAILETGMSLCIIR